MDPIKGPETVDIDFDEVSLLSLKLLALLSEEEAQVGAAVFALATSILRLMCPTSPETYDQEKEMDRVSGLVEYMDAVLSTDKKES